VDNLTPIHVLLEQSADHRGDAVALEHGDVVLTYGEIEAGANRVAARLRDLGVARGDRVGLLADNGRAYVEGFFGILKAGAGCVALNGANKARTTAALLADSGAVGLVTMAARVARDLPEIVHRAPDLRSVIIDRANPAWALPAAVRVLRAEDVASASSARVASDVGLDDLCTILYTSGSTGLPRGATLRHRNLAANTRQILAYLHLTADDSVLSVLPFHYSFGNSLLLTHFAVGGRVVVDNRFAYPSAVVGTLERSRVSSFSGVPSTYAILAANTDFLRRSWPDLRYLTQAGGAMTAALTRRLIDELPPHVQLFVMYGQTEASPRLSYVPPERLREKLGSIGIAIPGVTLTIRDEHGRECAPGEVGEVVAAGENLMQGYWNDPAETALVLKADGLHTGDLGRKDDDGFIFLVDRIKNMIKVGANRVSPREIEDVIAEVAGVAEVCVAGVPDELLGEAVEAFVVVAPGADVSAERILAHCREYLALYKVPRGLHFRDVLPRNAAGKVLRSELVRTV
jgi:acyl-CoA synthetase (AMP-forming)/AMP-acid ligase II